MTGKEVAILMATYNGERYLKEQIDSILAQTCQNWHLYVHDDGSTDGTKTILNSYAERHNDKITLLYYSSQGGARDNFLSLLMTVEAPYYMFCDQDDVWLPNKLEITTSTFYKLEAEFPENPLIVCSDLYIVDENLNIINQSMWAYSGIYPQYIRNFNDCGATAAVTGSTMLINHAVKACCIYPAPNAVMHDSWICLCALKNKGILHGIQQPLTYYRQHTDNCLGAGSADSATIGLLYRISNFRKMYRISKAYYKMLKSLNYGSVLKYIYYKLKYKRRIKKGHY